LKEMGSVISVQEDNLVTVQVKKRAACEGCGRCGGQISSSGDSLVIEAVSVADLKPGDLVELEISDSNIVRLSFLVYGLPLVSAGVGYGLGWGLQRIFGVSYLLQPALAVLGFLLSFVWLRHYDKVTMESRKYMPIARPVKRF